MTPRSQNGSAWAPTSQGLCVLAMGVRPGEADQVGLALTNETHVRLLVCDRPFDAVANMPAGQVDLAILGVTGSVAATRRLLRWIRRQWPKCLTVVLASVGGGELEIAARESGAMFLLRPTQTEDFQSLLEGVKQCRKTHMTSA